MIASDNAFQVGCCIVLAAALEKYFQVHTALFDDHHQHLNRYGLHWSPGKV